MKTHYASLYKRHHQAREEHAAWLHEIEQLRAQNRHTLALLGQIEALIRQYDADLQVHIARMSVYEIETQLDEELLAQQERLEGSPGYQQLALIRQRLEDELTQLHEKSKRYEALSVQNTQAVRPLFEQLQSVGLIGHKGSR